MTSASTAVQSTENIMASTLAVRPLPSPQALKAEHVLKSELARQIETQRQMVRDILTGKDDRLLVITGPCSLHDEEAALEYGRKLQALSEKVSETMLIVMRAYVEKPRTTTGWKGLAYDPQRDGSGNIEQGLNRSRALMLELIKLGLPLATEALNPMTMMYLDDLITWTAIGARTAESQIHREMISHLGMPVGIKNGTDGSVDTAVNAMISASRSHHCLGVDAQGNIAMLDTPGNPDTHVVLRGGRNLTNYDSASIAKTLEQLQSAKQGNALHPKVIVDCSHDNAQKQHDRQPLIAMNVVQQKLAGNQDISGIMLESFLEPGKQSMAGCNNDGCLKYGLSITDPCIGWEQTETLLLSMAQALAS
ncbi:MAG: 3-deoxy-7-phosphoheptulonate synthase [Gammaproteobacteria bacterium]|nr:3-deoxy-7-phosphoheptulonate synthase [Gammaproteobacteria bacterium]